MSRRLGTVPFISGMFIMSWATIPGIEIWKLRFAHTPFISGMFIMSWATIPSIEIWKLRFAHTRKLQMKWKPALRPRGLHVPSRKMRCISCLFLCLFPSQSLDQCAGCSMCIKTEMLCNGKNQEMFTKTFPLSARGLADTNGRATMAGDAVNQTRGQTSEGIFDG